MKRLLDRNCNRDERRTNSYRLAALDPNVVEEQLRSPFFLFSHFFPRNISRPKTAKIINGILEKKQLNLIRQKKTWSSSSTYCVSSSASSCSPSDVPDEWAKAHFFRSPAMFETVVIPKLARFPLLPLGLTPWAFGDFATFPTGLGTNDGPFDACFL